MEKLKKHWKLLVLLGVVVLTLGVLAGANKISKSEELSLDAVPEAVKATILKEANGAEVKEVEKEIEDGVIVYEADFVADGQEVEVKVAADGKLLSSQVEDEDDGEDNGNVDEDEGEDEAPEK